MLCRLFTSQTGKFTDRIAKKIILQDMNCIINGRDLRHQQCGFLTLPLVNLHHVNLIGDIFFMCYGVYAD
jgi:hypothetical protein